MGQDAFIVLRSKRYMRKGIMIHDNDRTILHYLYYGGALVSEVFLRFFDTGVGKKETHVRRMWRRLGKMIKAKLIRCEIDPKMDEMILFLNVKGAYIVCNQYSLDIDNAWLHSGKDYHHNLTTAALARRFIFESKVTTFSVDDLEFEHVLKRNRGLSGVSTKGVGYPDFRVYIITQSKKTKTCDIEVDCGTIGKRAFEKKIKGAYCPLLIVCNDVKRVNWLFGCIRYSLTTRDIYITTYDRLPENIFSPLKGWRPPEIHLITVTIWQ